MMMIGEEHKPIKDNYEAFAPFYDHYMKHVDYDHWTAKILSLYHMHGNRELNDILELACGTANIAERLVRMGFNVTASDRSEPMLKIAELKDFKPSLKLSDMTEAHPQRAYDLVILAFDSINYLLEPNQVSSMLERTGKSLKKGGVFVFDISTRKNSAENFNGYLNVDETSTHVIIHRAQFDTARNLQHTDLTIFYREDNHYLRREEHHVQRVYYVNELLKHIAHSCLECVGIYSLNSNRNLRKENPNKLDQQYTRLFFSCIMQNDTRHISNSL